MTGLNISSDVRSRDAHLRQSTLSSRSLQATATGRNAPHLPFAIPAGIGSVGWKGDLRPPSPDRGLLSRSAHYNGARKGDQTASAMITLVGPANGRRSSLRQPVCPSHPSAASSP